MLRAPNTRVSPSALRRPPAFDRCFRRSIVVPGGICVGVVCLLMLIVDLGAASAAGTLPFLGSFGSEGPGGGQFQVPRGVAVDGSGGSSKGDVYVADQFNQRVEKFNAAGGFILAFGSQVNETKVKERAEGGPVSEAEENVCTAASGDICTAGVAGEGGDQFNHPEGIAVDPSGGDVYVVDFSNHRIEKFGPSGEFLLAFGKEVDATTGADVCAAASGDPCQAGKVGSEADEFEWTLGSFIAVGATGTVYVGDANRLQEFESQGEHTGQITLSEAGEVTALAVDSSGDVYVVSSELSGVRKYNATGEKLAEFDPEREGGEIKAVALDPADGAVFVIDAGEGVRVRQYEPTGALFAESGEGLLEASTGIAVSAAGTVYAADSANEASANRVLLFGEPPQEGNPAPSIDAESVAGLGEEGATVEAQINPFFLETSYRVQYVEAAGYAPSAPDPYAAGREAPSAIGVGLGGGRVIGDQPASVVLQGLRSGTAYHYRFVATSAAGTTYGADQAFTTFQPSAFAGLPDGRIYEQVSETEKNGNEAGIQLHGNTPGVAYGAMSPDGERAVYYQVGPSGKTLSGTDLYSVATRNPETGWETAAALPPGHGHNASNFSGEEPKSLIPSTDLSRFVFAADGPFGAGNASETEDAGLYRTATDSGEPEWWLTEPDIPSPDPNPILNGQPIPVGGSPRLGTVYFTYWGTLVPEDASRAPYVTAEESNSTWGFYEWREGTLRSAAELPDGTYSRYGAVPAATLRSGEKNPSPDFLRNEVSRDGSKAFFVSPEPRRASEAGIPTELYVREQHEGEGRPATTVLVSRDELNGAKAAAGSGSETAVTPVSGSYVYASPDGSRAFFESADKLARSAGGAEPEGPGPWTYEFDLAEEEVVYLPGVAGRVLASSADGSSFIFANTSTDEIERWAGGRATNVASFSMPVEPAFEGARATSDGGVFVFNTDAILRSGSEEFNNSSGLDQVYRYQPGPTQPLTCISCAPPGTAQSPASSFLWSRVIDDGAKRVFFGTAEKLLARDVNGVEDVYEWEQAGTGSCAPAASAGCTYLISSGTSPDASFFLDNDEAGDNVLFATREGLLGGDADESYDVYDARVGGGFPHVAPPAPCTAGDCRQPGTPPSLPVVLSAAIGPSGNLLALPPQAMAPAGKVKIVKHSLRGHVARIVVQVPAAGRLVLAGSGLRSVGRTMTRAGRATLQIALTKAGVASLRRHGGRLQVKLKAVFRPLAGSPSTTSATLLFR